AGGGVRGGGDHHHRDHDPHGGAAAQPRDRDHAAGGRDRRLHSTALPAAGRHQGTAGRTGGGGALVRCVRSHQSVAHPGRVLLARAGDRDRRLRYADRPVWKCGLRGATLTTSVRRHGTTMRRQGKTSRKDVTERRDVRYAFLRRLSVTLLCYAFFATSLASQRPQPFDQQLRDNQQRLEGIRRERSDVEQELERLRTQAHSLADDLANIERQKETTNRIVNELDRQIAGLSDQIDRTTVDLLLAQNALAEKRAVLERRLVDIYKRGALYVYQVLLAAESFGDLLSRYKYLYLVSRQDRLLDNDMSKLQRRIARERETLVDARDALARRKSERTQELDRYLALERERQASLSATRRSARQALER